MDANGVANITVGDINNGTTDNCDVPTLSLSQMAFTCADTGMNMVTLIAEDASGNIDSCTAMVTVEDNTLPTAICQSLTVQLDANGNASITEADIDNGSTDNCSLDTMFISQYNFTCADAGANNVTLTVVDVNGNTSTCTAVVTVEDNVSPVALCNDTTIYLDANGTSSVTVSDVDGGSYDSCGIANMSISQEVFNCNDLGANTVVLTVEDNNGNVSTCNATVIVVDTLAPIVACQNITVQLDANGVANITVGDINNGTTDNCDVPTLSLSQMAFTCADTGMNMVTLIAEDASGNIDSCTAMVTVEDNTLPTAICQSLTVQLDANGNASITEADIDNGSTDNCSLDTVFISQYDFTCADAGANNVTLTVVDVNGNTSTCTAVVTVEDNVSPVALCNDTTIYLDANGTSSVTVSDVDGGSYDSCGIANMSISQEVFNCNDLGANTVVLTVEDNNGNVSICNATVTVVDTLAPVVVCQNVTVQLNANGLANITIADIDNGTTDNCDVPTLSLSQMAFTCADTGMNMVTLIAEDANGNIDSCTAMVTVEDITLPTAICQSLTLQLGAGGVGSITVADINNGSADNCSLDTMFLSQYDFTCADAGANNVTLTVVDVNGNTGICTAVVTVEDNVGPVALCNDTTIYLDANGTSSVTVSDVDGGSYDSCGIANMSISQEVFNCNDLGPNTVVLTVEDINGNVSICNSTVTVADTLAPIVICQNATVQLDANGIGTITTADLNSGTTDNCNSFTLGLSNSEFACSDIGTVDVTLYAIDDSGNEDSCIATVTVIDILPPVAICQNISIQLDNTGNASITAADIDNGSSDNCSIDTMTLSVYDFTCTDLGANSVTLTVVDSSGNIDTCTAIVTVEGDFTTPSVVCRDTTVYLDIIGQAIITNEYVLNNAVSVCGAVDTVLSQTIFDCTDLGVNNVSISVTDVNGLVGTCFANVTVIDTFTTTVLPYDSVCINSSITLEAVPGRPGSVINWYSDALGNNTIGVGNPFTTGPIAANTTIWVNELFGNGCESPLVAVDLTVTFGPAAIVSSNSPVCVREDIELTAESGFILYQWYGPNGFTSSTQNPVISNAEALDAGDYFLVTVGVDGCVSDSAVLTIVVQPDVVLATPLDATYTFCEDGPILVTPSLGAGQSGTWTGPNGFTSNTENISIALADENVHEGIYTFVVSDDNTGCTSIEYETFIQVVPRPEINGIVGANQTICPGESFTLEATQIAGVTYTWISPEGDITNDNPLEVLSASTSNTGVYSVYVTAGQCVSDTISAEVFINPQPDVQILTDTLVYTEGQPVTLVATGGVAYQWSPTDNIFDPNAAAVILNDLIAGDYTYQVLGFDINACLDSAEVTFVVLPEEILEIYDVITPNGDGYNDTWTIEFLENQDQYVIRIFARNGVLLYENYSNYNNDWDGGDLPDGAYYYIIETDGKMYKGGLTIIK